MAKILIPSKGCVYYPRGRRMAGFYQLFPALRASDRTPIIITGVDADEGDSVVPKATLDDKKFLFVMGEDFGNITISGVALLGQVQEQGRSNRVLRSYFQQHRTTRREQPVLLSMPGHVAAAVYLTRIVIAQPDPEFHIQPFMFRCISVEPKSR
jgi:hypothetical protein